jgi:hypothetical protein
MIFQTWDRYIENYSIVQSQTRNIKQLPLEFVFGFCSKPSLPWDNPLLPGNNFGIVFLQILYCRGITRYYPGNNLIRSVNVS